MAIRTGTNGNNKLYGTSAADKMDGKAGNDYLAGLNGNDTMQGGSGNDKLDGGSGNDTMRGGAGVDALFGGVGNDLLYGDAGNDYMDGGTGFDRLWGGSGNDRLLGNKNDKLDGGAGNDTLVWIDHGNSVEGDLLLKGGSGYDTLHINTKVTTAESPTEPQYKGDGIASVALGKGGIGSLSYTVGRQEISNVEHQGRFEGIERITVAPDTRLDYLGGTADATVVSGNRDDLFYLGSGNETITTGGSTGGYGGDIIRISLYNGPFGHDTITDFEPGKDFFVITGRVEPYDYPSDSFVWTQIEANGNTNLKISTHEGKQLVDLTLLGVTDLSPIQYSHQDWWG
jgi:Ca2+-binding RTX toxin-like protein